ncbi:MAG: RnfABCDGE type electron transport complex subunit B [Pseudomonadota bacterium]|nr:MAG: RnfABCDGE type electron transport complex subunit B [Pseudomonadota bacterium]
MSSAIEIAARIDSCLPQTQCTRCGYPRCLTYAEAMARGEADINQCPPGGDITIQALARLLQVDTKPLNPANGSHQGRVVAWVDEELCIGCRKCVDVCPVDAIIGANKLMHTVIAAQCTGCELCLPPCPVDCIRLRAVNIPVDRASPWPDYTRAETEQWRRRAAARLQRLDQRRAARGAAKTRRRVASDQSERERIRAEIRAAVERVRRRKSSA